ncbi:hypothetical protein PPL_01572 [Heterostelium album PN500]|uniref:Uncharacterized protein n=1 Tax=Heterostelium pallidum (strain ATCC 26659 / Pp 5 / PN500) TaxID=670386 RepID=D3AZV8_HETP5|nr:hypothetical protein PPL_01572 [Heterostelium album PN500]EFA84582.1 hypothetical protein PPL_01572 [Heterostelium album PN500]|eukprot:XP_020436695.1 hypothetical protein PPL_01572 [Heterostelium album PN500]
MSPKSIAIKIIDEQKDLSEKEKHDLGLEVIIDNEKITNSVISHYQNPHFLKQLASDIILNKNKVKESEDKEIEDVLKFEKLFSFEKEFQREKNRYPKEYWVTAIQDALIETVLNKEPTNINDNDDIQLNNTTFSHYCNTLFNKYFFHFDKIESIFKQDPKETIDLFSAIWNCVFHVMVSFGNPVFITSSSPFMISIGKPNTYNSIYSHTYVDLILIHTLEEDHVKQLMKDRNLEIKNDTLKFIMEFTAGVPRLINQTLDYMEMNGIKVTENTNKNIRDYLRDSNRTLGELNPFLLKLKDNQKILYIELIRACALGLSVEIKSTQFELTSDLIGPLHSTEIYYIDFIDFYRFHVSPIDDNHVKLKLPMATFSEIQESPSLDEDTKKKLSLISPLFYDKSIVASVDPFEICFKLSVSSKMINGLETDHSFEFLHDTWIGKHSFLNDQIKVSRYYPIIRAQNMTSPTMTFDKMNEILEYIKSDTDTIKDLTYNYNFETLWRMSNTNILYETGPNSESQDFYIKINDNLDKCYWGSKSPKNNGTPIRMVLVIVAMNSEDALRCGWPRSQNNLSKYTEFGSIFYPGFELQQKVFKRDQSPSDGSRKRAKTGSFKYEYPKIPENIQLVILGEEGLELRVFDDGIQDMMGITLSPSNLKTEIRGGKI